MFVFSNRLLPYEAMCLPALLCGCRHKQSRAHLLQQLRTNFYSLDRCRRCSCQCRWSHVQPHDTLWQAAFDVLNDFTCCRIHSDAGLLSSYVHTSPAPGLGRMAALVALETSASSLSSDQQADARVRCFASASMPTYMLCLEYQIFSMGSCGWHATDSLLSLMLLQPHSVRMLHCDESRYTSIAYLFWLS